jgi:hypothetical protein
MISAGPATTISATTRIFILRLAAVAMLGLGVQQAQAGLVPRGWTPSGVGGPATGPTASPVSYSFDGVFEAGYATLLTVDLGGGSLAATGGTLIVTAGVDLGTYTLFANQNSSNAALSPASAFTYDDLLSPASNQLLDGFGLLFTNTGGGAAGVQEVNMFGSAPGVYNFYSFNGSGYNVQEDLPLVPRVPEPSGLTLCSLAIVSSFGGMGWLKRRRTGVA